MSRRRWLRGAAFAPWWPAALGSALGVAAAPRWAVAAAPVSAPRLLLVFLRGGYDATSLLVPLGSRFYREARPTIALAPPSADPGAALPLDADWGLHPALRDSLWPLYGKGQLAFVPFAGTPDLSRSHFETQDSIELGLDGRGGGGSGSGFLHRLVERLGGRMTAAAFTDQQPLVMRGAPVLANVSVRSAGATALSERERTLINAMYAGRPEAAEVSEGFATQQALREQSAEMQAADRQAIGTRGFEGAARQIARLMADRYRIGFIDVGGWDTHVAQGGATGALATRLEELGRGLGAFAQTSGSAWQDTVVVVISEFGRTFRENGNRGTDHGHGSVYWVLGGGLRGGRIIGEQVALERANLFQDRDLPVLNDYRQLLGGMFARLYGLGPDAQTAIFPGGPPVRDFGLI